MKNFPLKLRPIEHSRPEPLRCKSHVIPLNFRSVLNNSFGR